MIRERDREAARVDTRRDRVEFHKLQKRLRRQAGEAIVDGAADAHIRADSV